MSPQTLAIDFGTSNSAAGVLIDGKPHLVEIESGATTMPTSIFFDFATNVIVYGSVANASLIQGREGRYMRSLKSVLGTSLMREKRNLMGQQLTFLDIISQFLKQLKSRAEATQNVTFDRALSGRPVHFHSNDPQKDAQAVVDLRECYELAGFKEVQFMPEPEAAALAYGALDAGKTGLIVDIGGGTSDFSVFRTGANGIEIIASHGVRIGGTNFDKSISVDHVMPEFGRGTEIRHEFGPKTTTAPNAIFQDLATWQKIPFLYTHETRRAVADLERYAVDKNLFTRLGAVLEHELGHDVAFAVERGKIDINHTDCDRSAINLTMVEPNLAVEISNDDLSKSLAPNIDKILTCAIETLDMANISPDKIDKVIFVGGSSLMQAVESAMVNLLPGAELHRSDAFTAIGDGLALATAKSWVGPSLNTT